MNKEESIIKLCCLCEKESSAEMPITNKTVKTEGNKRIEETPIPDATLLECGHMVHGHCLKIQMKSSYGEDKLLFKFVKKGLPFYSNNDSVGMFVDVNYKSLFKCNLCLSRKMLYTICNEKFLESGTPKRVRAIINFAVQNDIAHSHYICSLEDIFHYIPISEIASMEKNNEISEFSKNNIAVIERLLSNKDNNDILELFVIKVPTLDPKYPDQYTFCLVTKSVIERIENEKLYKVELLPYTDLYTRLCL